jgi:hypothetical protein
LSPPMPSPPMPSHRSPARLLRREACKKRWQQQCATVSAVAQQSVAGRRYSSESGSTGWHEPVLCSGRRWWCIAHMPRPQPARTDKRCTEVVVALVER